MHSSLIDHQELGNIQEELTPLTASTSPASPFPRSPPPAAESLTTCNVHRADIYSRPRSALIHDQSSSPSPSNAMLQSFSASDVPPMTTVTSPTDHVAVMTRPQSACAAVPQPGSESCSTTTLLARYWWPPPAMAAKDNKIIESLRNAPVSTVASPMTARPGDAQLDATFAAAAVTSPASLSARAVASYSDDRPCSSQQVRVEVNGSVSYGRPMSSTLSGATAEERPADALGDHRYATAPQLSNRGGVQRPAAAARSVYYPETASGPPYHTYAAVGGKLVPTAPWNYAGVTDASYGTIGKMIPMSATRQWHLTHDGYRVPPTATIHRSHGTPSRSFLHQQSAVEPMSVLKTRNGKIIEEVDEIDDCPFPQQQQQQQQQQQTVGVASVEDPGCRSLVDCTGANGNVPSPKSTLQSYCI
jgi:hypothetical protein